MKMPKEALLFFQEADVAEAMDCGVYASGTEVYGATRVIKELCERMGWDIPADMTHEQHKNWLIANNREDEIEYLM